MTAKRLGLRLSLLQNLSVEALVDAMNPMSYQKVYMEGVHSLFPEQKLVGQAVTLRFLPVREDLKTETRIGEDSPEYKAIEACGPGMILVADAMGVPYASIGGDIKFSRLKKNGAAGIVTDGAIRDLDVLLEEDYGLSVYAKARSFHGNPSSLPADENVQIQCGGALVRPGDIMVGDNDGVLVVPSWMAENVLEWATEHEGAENLVKEKIKAENVIPGKYYPPTQETIEEWRKRNSKQRVS